MNIDEKQKLIASVYLLNSLGEISRHLENMQSIEGVITDDQVDDICRLISEYEKRAVTYKDSFLRCDGVIKQR